MSRALSEDFRANKRPLFAILASQVSTQHLRLQVLHQKMYAHLVHQQRLRMLVPGQAQTVNAKQDILDWMPSARVKLVFQVHSKRSLALAFALTVSPVLIKV